MLDKNPKAFAVLEKLSELKLTNKTIGRAIKLVGQYVKESDTYKEIFKEIHGLLAKYNPKYKVDQYFAYTELPGNNLVWFHEDTGLKFDPLANKSWYHKSELAELVRPDALTSLILWLFDDVSLYPDYHHITGFVMQLVKACYGSTYTFTNWDQSTIAMLKGMRPNLKSIYLCNGFSFDMLDGHRSDEGYGPGQVIYAGTFKSSYDIGPSYGYNLSKELPKNMLFKYYYSLYGYGWRC